MNIEDEENNENSEENLMNCNITLKKYGSFFSCVCGFQLQLDRDKSN